MDEDLTARARRKPSVLILSQYYVPESGAPQNRWHGLATRLVQLWHDVKVLTAMPNYPAGRIYSGYRGNVSCHERIGPVNVYRTWLYATPSRSLSRRMLNYLSFGMMALLVGFLRVRDVDLLIFESPPLFLGPFAKALAVLKRAKCVMNVSDLWPASAVALGLVSREGLATRMAERLEMWLYRHSDAITGQTKGIVDDIAERVPEVPVHLFPNGVDLDMFSPAAPEPGLAERLGLAGKFVVGYGGIIGYAQALHQVLEAAGRLKDVPEITFALFGDGPLKGDLIARTKELGLTNVTFFPRQDRTLMPTRIALWDVGLVPLADHPLFDGARPSKMFELMGQAKPVLFCGRGEGAAIVADNDCGLVVPPERPEALAEAIRALHAHPAKLEQLGRNGRRAAERHFDRARIAEQVSKLFESLA
jgi:colanic acid biosynthesis glycosyl transferase WcaI